MNENRERQLLEALPQAVVLLDDQLQVRLANQAASRLFELPAGQLVGTPLASLAPCKDLPRLIRDSGQQSARSIEIHPEPGEPHQPARILRITIVQPPLDPEQKSFLLVLEDVSERVLLEDRLLASEKLSGMSQLAAGIAHELRNPMSSVASHLEYIRRSLLGNGDAALDESLEATLDGLNQMQRLLQELSSFTAQPSLRFEPVDLTRLIRRSLVLIAREAEARGIEVVTRLAESLPSSRLDPRAIGQVLLNVFKNAIEAMPSGGRLTVSTRPASLSFGGSAAVAIDVEDTGTGIEEADLRRVFRPLFTTKPGGMGLGLSFCRQMIEEHGGEIRLASRKGQGAAATILLPLEPAA